MIKHLNVIENEFPTDAVRDIMRQIISGLEYLHNFDTGESEEPGFTMIHRDIKPSNILISIDDSFRPQAYIVDFGTTRDYATSVRMTKGIGTYFFSAPEVGLPECGPKSDVFSFGKTCLCLLQRQSSISDTALKTQLNAVADKLCQELLSDCLEDNPGLRPTSNEVLTLSCPYALSCPFGTFMSRDV